MRHATAHYVHFAAKSNAMEMILFIGCQGAGKTTFYRERFFKTHVRVNLDMLKTRHRERLLVLACLHMKQRFVVDNTNATVKDRQRYFDLARDSHFKVIGYHFDATIEDALARNAQRAGKERIPEIGVRGTFARLVPPSHAEGFDELYRARVQPDGKFEVVKRAIDNESS